ARRECAAAAGTELRVGAPERTGRGGGGGEAFSAPLAPARALGRRMATKDLERLVWRQRVGDVAELHAAHDLLGPHIDEQLPNRLARDLAPKVPHTIDNRRGGEVDHAFFRADP